MESFLHQVALAHYRKYGAEISNIAFIFPNRRAGKFFQKALGEITEKPLISPQILTITDFIARLTPYRAADRTSMLFSLFTHYQQLTQQAETFDNFLFWGEMLLNDFDDIDKYRVNAKQLFGNLSDLKEIENSYDFLEPSQIEAIQRFWSHFSAEETSLSKSSFLSIWNILFELYTHLRTELSRKNEGYEGMISEHLATKIKTMGRDEFPLSQIVVVGLNALTTSEEVIWDRLRDLGIADFYWDYDSPFVTDSDNKASYFVGRNQQRYPSKLPLANQAPLPTHIEVISIPSAVGQAKEAGDIIQQLIDRGEVTPEKALNTAIVLPDETLLMPLLHAIPQAIQSINITMGYSMNHTIIGGFIETLLAIQRQVRNHRGITTYYHQAVLNLLSHPLVQRISPQAAITLADRIRRNNLIFVSEEEFAQDTLLKRLFRRIEQSDDCIPYLLEIFDTIVVERELISPLEYEFIYHYYTAIKHVEEVMSEFDVSMTADTLFLLITRLTNNLSIPFEGEPLSGLQVMGVLETRALDFDNLILLSMNEGVFPAAKAANSFIPHALREAFGLSTYHHQDSMASYYFYRLIHRAKRVYLLYDSRTEEGSLGEMSRYIYQLKHHYRHPLTEEHRSYEIAVKERTPLIIQKTPYVMGRLRSFLTPGGATLSASSINTYIDCPLKFYLSSVEAIREPDEIEERIGEGSFGSIVHKTMELLYAPFTGREITATTLEAILKNSPALEQKIEEAFSSCYFKGAARKLTGHNYLIGQIIQRYILSTLKHDKGLAPFIYVAGEQRIVTTLAINQGVEVNVKAIIDRVDRVKGITRIVDYKSGKVNAKLREITEMFDRTKGHSKRPSALMQLLFYARLYEITQPVNGIQPAIYQLKTIEQSGEAELTFAGTGEFSYEALRDLFLPELHNCIAEIFDPATPFTQTQCPEECCTYCHFAHLCAKRD